MGYSRSLRPISKVLKYLNPVLTAPTVAHELECGTWDQARRLAYSIREGLYAAQFHEGYEHVAKLKLTHQVTHQGSCVRLVPKLDETMIRALQPLPTWARYSDTRKTTIICDSATSVVDVLASCRSLSLDSPWKEVVFPRIRWSSWTRKQREATHETATALRRRVLDLDDQGISFVLVGESDDLFLSIYYDPDEEEENVDK